jgi:aldehyde:ferredoxin oxidoreductase
LHCQLRNQGLIETLDESGVELFKTNFYKLEGWDVSTGWPTKEALQRLSLNKVADTLGKRKRIWV